MATVLAVMMLFSLGVSGLAEAPAAVVMAAGATEAADRTDLAAEGENATVQNGVLTMVPTPWRPPS